MLREKQKMAGDIKNIRKRWNFRMKFLQKCKKACVSTSFPFEFSQIELLYYFLEKSYYNIIRIFLLRNTIFIRYY